MRFQSIHDAFVHIRKSGGDRASWTPLRMTAAETFALLEKSGIAPADLAVGGTITPSRGREILSAIYDQSQFLSKVTRVDMRSLEQDVPAITMGVGNLTRWTSGTDPASGDYKKPTEKGKRLYAKKLDLLWQILEETTIEFRDMGDIVAFVRGEMAKAFANEILNLGMVGINDDFAGSAYNKLNKGWIYLAKASADSHKVDISNIGGVDETGHQIQIMRAMLKQLPSKWKGESLAFLVPYAAAEDYNYEIANLGGAVLNAQVLMSALAKEFMTRSIEAIAFCPDDTYVLTPYKNIIHGMSTDVQNKVEVRPVKGSIDNRSTIFNDYEFAFDDAVVVAYDI